MTDVDEQADWNDRISLTSYGDDLRKADGIPTLINPPGFQEAVDEYGKEVYQLMRRLLAILSEGIGQPSEFFFNKIGGNRAGIKSSPKFYPPCPEPDLVMGLSPHEDARSVLSFVHQEDVAGLEVLKDGGWVLVQPIPHAYVVNVGVILQLISNGRFQSVVHRVCSTYSPAGRYSFASFTILAHDTIVQPAMELCNETEPPLYKPVKYHDIIVDFSKQGGVRPGFAELYKLDLIVE